MRRFRFAALAAVAVFGFASAASAADLPVKAPVYAPPPVWSWTGFYLGVNAGGSIGRDPTTLNTPTENLGSATLSPAGFIGGGQLGYNYQFAPNWVAGIEGDFQGASQKDSACFLTNCEFSVDQKVEWFATLRARVGYTNGDWLWYVTGGGAWAQIQNDFAFSGGAGSASFDQSGWVIGGGVETHLTGGWTAKLEYLYMDLGSITDTTPNAPNVTQTSNIRDNIVRVGLNYKFN